MKLVYPGINCVFDTDCDRVNCIVIENQSLFCSLLEDVDAQLNGFDGRLVISEGNKPLNVSKYFEVITQFIPFEMSRKSLVNKITAELEKKAVSSDFYAETAEIISRLENHLINLAFDFSCDINYNKLEIGSIIKASGIEINSNYDNLGEKIIDYMELVTEFDRRKLFFTVNLRSYLSDADTEEFMKTVVGHGFNVIMLESSEHPRLDSETRYIIDSDLCEIC